jgi:hypothetical protein
MSQNTQGESQSDVQLGPVDFLVVEFPGAHMTGEGLPLLVDLVDRGIIRVLDLVFVKKRDDGTVLSVDLSEIDRDGTRGLAIFDGASSGLLGPQDLAEVGEALEPGSAAAILVYENRWAAPLATALARGGARLVAGARIPVPVLLEALDAVEAQTSIPAAAGTREG